MSHAEQLTAEQQHIDRAYQSLDAEVARLSGRRDAALGRQTADATAHSERDAEVTRLTARLRALMHAEPRVSFGRIDRSDGLRLHIGPVGLREGDERLVIDWRAPAAQPFYAATAREPLGLARRRQITLEDRRVIRLDDDLFDDSDGADGLVGEGALLSALAASRDGRMHDAVATLQAEQDAIVRASKSGVLVVQGAPGTGKTVVALHRAAYLLYRWPEVLRRGVLVIGPTARFLDYIGDVLPALGETNVVTSTIDGLLPGLDGSVRAEPGSARVLGDARIAEALAAFLSGLQGRTAPDGHTVVWDGDPLLLPRTTIQACAARARKLHQGHNVARETFLEFVLDELTLLVEQTDAARLADVEAGFEDELRRLDTWLEKDPDALMPRRSEDDRAGAEALEHRQLRAELAADQQVLASLDELWPRLTAERAVSRLLREGLDDRTAAFLDRDQRDLLARSAEGGWTDAHVPLLDEAAELLGEDEDSGMTAAARSHRRELAHAERVIASTPGLSGRVSAQDLAALNTEADTRDLATRALADRTWAYGHVIVDEAQELTPMQWRMLARRCPTRSMTVVGDIAQTSAPLGTTTWTDRLAELRTEPRQEELSICYRSPRELVEAVRPLLRQLRPDARELDAIRSSGRRPTRVHGDVEEIEQIARWTRCHRGEGQRVIISPEPDRVLAALAAAGIDASGEDLRESLLVLAPVATKGLEFDHVLVSDPDRIVAEHGAATLYVALTRATATLAALQRGQLRTSLGEAWEDEPAL